MLVKKIFKNSHGDTIVEVMLAVAVMSLVLAISYSLSNKNSQSIRTAHERGEAQKLAEEQLEQLRGYITEDVGWTDKRCFDRDGMVVPSAPAEDAINRCQFGPDGLYNLNIVPTDDDTYTATVSWDTLSGNPATLELSYRLPEPTSPDIALNQVCSNTEDDDGDGLIDAADPGCHTNGDAFDAGTYNPDDTSEDNPLLPICSNFRDDDGDGLADAADPGCHTNGNPGDSSTYDPNGDNEQDPFIWSTNGWRPSTCVADTTSYLPSGDGRDLCHQNGNSMYGWRTINFAYNGIPAGLKVGAATLRVCYQNYGGILPPGYGSYQLKATVGHGPTQTMSLPVSSPPNTERCANQIITIHEVNSSTLRMVWFNDANPAGGDANLQINSIRIMQKINTPQGPNKAIAGGNYILCQPSGLSDYCLTDTAYSNSLYSLSSNVAAGTPFKASYKFDGLATGNYSLAISYFNRSYDNLNPPSGYSYQIRITYPTGTRNVSLPIENTTISRHLHDSPSINLNITSANPTITIEWRNDSWLSGVYDANFGIRSVLLRGN